MTTLATNRDEFRHLCHELAKVDSELKILLDKRKRIERGVIEKSASLGVKFPASIRLYGGQVALIEQPYKDELSITAAESSID